MKAICTTAVLLAAFCRISSAQCLAELSGRLVTRGGSARLSGLVVRVLPSGRSTTSDERGRFVLRGLPCGAYTLVVRGAGLEEKRLSVSLNRPEEDLGDLPLQSSELEAGYARLSEAELSSDRDAIDQRVSPLLQASRDVFLRRVAYHLRPYGFVPRGYDARFSTVLLNGIPMNDPYNGRPNWRDWGGLNDVTRHPQELRYALQFSDYTFSGVGRLTAIDTRAADYGHQLGFSGSWANGSYRQRLMVTYASGLMRDGWALLFSASHRWAREGRIEGTSYDAWAYFSGVEKRFASHYSLSLCALGAPTRWAGHSPNTREVYALKGGRYNAYWGWQNGKKRNERMRHRYAPLFQLSAYWTPSEKLQWTNTFSCQFGGEGRSRLQTYQAPKPSPTYYRKLPSYFRSQNRFRAAADARRRFLGDSSYAQIDWPTLYRRNRHNLRTITDPDGHPGTFYTGRQAAYYLAEDRRHIIRYEGSSRLFCRMGTRFSLRLGLARGAVWSAHDRRATDLLGADFVLDKDPYTDAARAADNDLRKPNHIAFRNDPLAYAYRLYQTQTQAFSGLRVSLSHWDGFLSTTAAHSTLQRFGERQNGRYPNRSLGPSEKIGFTDWGLKAGLTLKVDGQHYLSARGLYQSLAPSAEQVFPDLRNNALVTPGLGSTQVYSADLSYDYRSGALRAKVSLYYTQFRGRVHLDRYYLEDFSPLGQGGEDFFTFVMPDVATRHRGVEAALEGPLSAGLSASMAFSAGQYTYANLPQLYGISDATKGFEKIGKAYLENYKLGATPQQAYTLGFSYESSRHERLGIFGDYLASLYVAIAPVLRTRAFITDPATQLPYRGLREPALREVWRQERLPDRFMLDFSAGKTWWFHGYRLGITLVVHNVRDNRHSTTGGFESARAASYPLRHAEQLREYPVFGTRYGYRPGTRFFLNLSLRL